MSRWDDPDRDRRHDKWANWTVKPKQDSTFWVKHVSAALFVLVAGIQMIEIVA